MPIFEDCGYEIADKKMFEAVSYCREKEFTRIEKLGRLHGGDNRDKKQLKKSIENDVYATSKRFKLPKYGIESIGWHMDRISLLIDKQKRNDHIDLEKDIAPMFKPICTSINEDGTAQLKDAVLETLNDNNHPLMVALLKEATFETMVFINLPDSLSQFVEPLTDQIKKHLQDFNVKFVVGCDEK